MKRKFLSIVLSLIIFAGLTLFSGCFPFGGWFIDTDYSTASENLEKFISCVEDKDKDGIKKLFAANKIENIENFDESVESLLGYIEGDYISYTGGGLGTDESIHYGHVVKIHHMSNDVTTTEGVYRLSFDWCVKDTDDKGNVGIWSFYVIKFEDDPFKEYYYWGDGLDTFGINIGKTYLAKFQYNCVWNDQSCKMSFRNISRGFGNGSIQLNGKEVEAGFVIYQNSISVSVLVKDLDGFELQNQQYGVATESFDIDPINSDGLLTSTSESVVLFGENFGKIFLSFREFETEEDWDSVEPWEYYENWRDGQLTFCINDIGYGYFSRKCRKAVINTPNGEKEAIFQWLPDKKFAIYEYREGAFVEEGEQTIAEGTYAVADFGEIVLTFTKDEKFSLLNSSVTIERDPRKYSPINTPWGVFE